MDDRAWLVEKIYSTSRDFDKAVITLSGGALGLSIAFLRDLFPHPEHEWALASAWGLFTASLLLIFVSIITSERSMRSALDRLDAGTVDRRSPGGLLARVTGWLNAVAGGLLILGVVLLAVFAFNNL